MFQSKAEIIYNKRIKKDYFEIALSASGIARAARPGQFVNIKVSDSFEPLLRRPLSIHKISHQVTRSPGHQKKERKHYVFILYEVIGKGTQLLSRRKAGESLDVIGPLGNGFTIDRRQEIAGRRPVLVAGGMGTAPLVFLAEGLVRGLGSRVPGQPLVLIGAKTKEHILCEKEFKDLGCEVKIATDDGSRGFSGRVTDLLKNILQRPEMPPLAAPRHSAAAGDWGPATIYACGPRPMLKEISRIGRQYNVPAQVSLESHMACGIGACMGCIVKIAHSTSHIANTFEYKRVCKDGPVFSAREIIWE